MIIQEESHKDEYNTTTPQEPPMSPQITYDFKSSKSDDFASALASPHYIPTQTVKLPLTQVGNVALTKGMYIALMKRKEQIAFGNTSYSSTPRPRSSSSNQNIKSFASCTRTANESFVEKRQEWPIIPLRQKKEKQYQEIHKTKRIKKQNEGFLEKQKSKKVSAMKKENFLEDISQCYMNNSNISNQNQIVSMPAQCSSQQLDSKIGQQHQIEQENNKKAVSQNRKKSTSLRAMKSIKQPSKTQLKLVKKKINSNCKVNSNNWSQEKDEENSDKENNFGDNLQPKIGSNSQHTGDEKVVQNKNKCKQKNPSVCEYINIWYEEAQDLATERAMFVQKLKKSKKRRNVPGYRVKFETSQSKIFAFNCFHDKDLSILKKFRPTIDIQQDNDNETDSEQLKESVCNVFQSLCVAVCEEKISAQIRLQLEQQQKASQSSIY